MGLWKSSAYCTAHSIFPSLGLFSCSTAPQAFSRPDQQHAAQWPSRTALLQRRRRLVLDGREHGGTLWQIGPRSKMIQVELAFRARIAPQPCIRQVSGDPDHDASYASAAKLRAADPFSKVALNAMACYGWPSPRIMIGSNVCSSGSESLSLPPLLR